MDNENTPLVAPEVKKSKRWKIAGLILLSLILLSASFGGGMFMAQKNEFVKSSSLKEADYLGKVYNKYVTAPANKLTQDVDFNLFWKVWDLLKEKYVDKNQLADKQMFYGSVPVTLTVVKKYSAPFNRRALR